MKIIYLGSFRLPNFDAGAPRVINNAKILRELGCEVSFLSWGGEYRKNDLCEDGKYRVDGFEYFITGELSTECNLLQRIFSKFIRGKKTLKILSNLQEKPDLIIMYNAEYAFTKKMLSFSKLNNIKLANDITEWYDSRELKFFDKWLNEINMSSIQHKVLNKIPISTYLSNYYSSSNNVVIPPLCDLADKKWTKTLGEDEVESYNGITLIYAGTPTLKDCLHTSIDAVNILAKENIHIRLLILGSTKENYLRRFSYLLKDVDLHENICFLGKVSQDLIPAYYRKADFMILLREPNRKNMAGFPTKFSESITSGVPVITNSTSDIEQYLDDGKNGILVPGYTLEDILYSLRTRLLTMNREEIEGMKKYTKSRNNLFDWHLFVDRFREFLMQIK